MMQAPARVLLRVVLRIVDHFRDAKLAIELMMLANVRVRRHVVTVIVVRSIVLVLGVVVVVLLHVD